MLTTEIYYISKLQPEANGSDIEVHNQWQQQEVPWYGSFSSPDYPSQIPIKFYKQGQVNYKNNIL